MSILNPNTPNQKRIGTTPNGSQFDIDANNDNLRRIRHQIVGFNKDDKSAFGQFGHEMSQDHYTGLLFGLYFVFKFVDNDLVSPETKLPAFRLIDETKRIVRRLTDFISMPKNVDIVDETDDFKKDKFKAIQNAKWVVSNPHETKVVARGGKSYSLGLNYPWAVIANEILSNNIYQKASGEYNQIKLNDEIKKTQILDQKAKFKAALISQVSFQNFQINQSALLGKQYVGSNIFNFNMLLKLGTMSRIYSKNDIVDGAGFIFQFKGDLWKLLFEGLHQEQPTISLNVLLNKFNELNLHDINNFDNNIDFKDINNINSWNFENKFNMSSGSIGDKGTKLQIGEFNGLDFMLAHNLTRILHPLQGFENTSNQNGLLSLITSTLLDINKNHISNLNYSFTTQSFNTNYRDYKIPVPEYLSHSVQINTSNGKLNVLGDLWVCSGGNIELNNSGQLGFVNLNTNPTREIIFKNNSVLNIKENGKLIIENNTMVKIEKDASLIIHPGAQIILNGPNAVLYLNGKLILEPNAIFKPVAGALGYGKIVVENMGGEFYVQAKGNNQMIIDAGNKDLNVNLEVFGEYGMHAGWAPGLKLFEIKNSWVKINPKSRIVSEAVVSNLNNIKAEGKDWPKTEEEKSIGFIFLRTKLTVTNSLFVRLKEAVSFVKVENGTRPFFESNAFTKCQTGIKLNGSNAWLKSNQFNWGNGNKAFGSFGVQALGNTSNIIANENHFNLPNIARKNLFNIPINTSNASFYNFGRGTVNLLKNFFQSGQNAINNKDGNILLECNQFTSWEIAAHYNNAILSSGGILHMENGHNKMDVFQKYINSMQTILYLNNGNNLFKFTTAAKNPFIIKINDKQPLVLSDNFTEANTKQNNQAIAASNNYWNIGDYAVASDFKPYSQNNYNILIYKTGNSYDMGYFPTKYYANGFKLEESAFCTDRFNGQTKYNLGAALSPFFPDVININEDFSPINFVVPTGDPKKPSTVVTGQNIMKATAIMAVKVLNDSINYADVIKEAIYFTQLVLPDSLSALNMVNYQFLHDVYNQAINDTLFSDSVSMAFANDNAPLIIALQDSLINRSNTTGSFWRKMRYELYRDKALTLKTIKQRTQAMAVLDIAMTDTLVSTLLQSHASSWKCIINQEQQFLDTVLTIYTIDFATCMPPENDQSLPDYETFVKDTVLSLCDVNVENDSNLTTTYIVASNHPYIVFNEQGDTLTTDSLNQVVFHLGEYVIVENDTANNNFYLTNIVVNSNKNCYPLIKIPSVVYLDTIIVLSKLKTESEDSIYYNYTFNDSIDYMIVENFNDTLEKSNAYKFHLGTYIITAVDTIEQITYFTRYQINLHDSCEIIDDEYNFQFSDTFITVCDNSVTNLEDLSYEYLVNISAMPYKIYDEEMLLLPENSSHTYYFKNGSYSIIHTDSVNKIYYMRFVTIEISKEETVTDTIPLDVDCTELPIPFSTISNDYLVYENNNLMDSLIYNNLYSLDPTANTYSMSYRNAATCQMENTTFSFIEEVPKPHYMIPINYIYAKYDREEDSCAFVRLDGLSCNGTPLTFGNTIDIYDILSSQLSFTANIEQYGNSTIGFRFCPPHWNTDEAHITDWYAFVYKANMCDYCRIDFKADSLVVFDKQTNSINKTNTQNIALYPNPATQVLNLLINQNLTSNIDILVFDNMGRKVLTQNHSPGQSNLIPLSLIGLSNGVYYVQIPQLGYNQKFVVLKE